MDNLKDLVQAYSVKKDHLIKKICEPLNVIGIPHFSYFRIDADGRFGNFSNYAKNLEFYYDKRCYLDYPYLIHPHLINSGCIFTTVASDIADCEEIYQLFRMFYMLIIFERLGDTIEGFVFAPKDGIDPKIAIDFFAKLDLLNRFISYFKKQAKPLIDSMMEDNFNLKAAKGENFFKADPSSILLNKNPKVLKYIKTICPLTFREQQCLELFKQGNSAQATAAILGLSQRTVEHYIDNMKDKLGCHSKWELLEW